MIVKKAPDSVGDALVYNVAQVAQLLGLGKTATWEAIWRGEIPHIRVGRRVLVPRLALEHFLAQAGVRNTHGQC